MATAEIIDSGDSQAVLLPKEIRLSGTQVEVFRRGDEVILVEKPESASPPGEPQGMERIFDLLASMPEDMFENIKDERPPEKREEL